MVRNIRYDWITNQIPIRFAFFSEGATFRVGLVQKLDYVVNEPDRESKNTLNEILFFRLMFNHILS